MSARIDTIVIGGGLHGLSCALHLAREGQHVTLIEEAWIGRHASGASAAGVRTLNRALEELPIGFEASAMWHRIATIVGDDCGFHADGQIEVAESPADLAVLEKRQSITAAAGFHHEELIERDELFRLVPALSPHCLGGLITRTDGAADPHRTLRAYRRSAEAAGVVILEGQPVVDITPAGTAGWRVHLPKTNLQAVSIVNAAGAWAGRIANMVGDAIRLSHKASMMIVTERITPFVRPVVGAVRRPLSFKQTSQGTLVLGGGVQGTADLEAKKSWVNFGALAESARAAVELFPGIRDVRIVRSWTGMEAKTEDLLPVIGPSPSVAGIFHAFGFSGHGFQLVPVVGPIIADLIIRGSTSRQIGAFDARRLMYPTLTKGLRT